LLKIDNIDVFYGEVQALRAVSLRVEKGEMVTVIGANGAGKTTTLKTITGLLKPKNGSIEFLGERIDLVPGYNIVKRGIALIPEGRELFPEMTTMENLILGAYTRKNRKKINEDLEQVFKLFPVLKERRDQMAGTLSGGERQMLAIGRGLMSSPKLLMLDEPSLGLAPKIVETIFSTIQEINRQGVTILLVEQNARWALSVASRAYVIETGRIVLEGRGEDLLNNENVKRAYLGM